MDISVIIPTYNRKKTLARAIRSVLNQSFSPFEILIIDDGSNDGTEEWVKANFQSIKYIYQNNHGVSSARNVGIENAYGDWVAFLDSDDWWDLEKLQVLFESISENVDLIYHDLEVINNQSRFFSRKKIKSWQVKTPILINLLLKGNCIANSSVVVRKSLLEKIGGLNESLAVIAAEDYNTWLNKRFISKIPLLKI